MENWYISGLCWNTERRWKKLGVPTQTRTVHRKHEASFTGMTTDISSGLIYCHRGSISCYIKSNNSLVWKTKVWWYYFNQDYKEEDFKAAGCFRQNPWKIFKWQKQNSSWFKQWSTFRTKGQNFKISDVLSSLLAFTFRIEEKKCNQMGWICARYKRSCKSTMLCIILK